MKVSSKALHFAPAPTDLLSSITSAYATIQRCWSACVEKHFETKGESLEHPSHVRLPTSFSAPASMILTSSHAHSQPRRPRGPGAFTRNHGCNTAERHGVEAREGYELHALQGHLTVCGLWSRLGINEVWSPFWLALS